MDASENFFATDHADERGSQTIQFNAVNRKRKRMEPDLPRYGAFV
jgi:hypothetical protein